MYKFCWSLLTIEILYFSGSAWIIISLIQLQMKFLYFLYGGRGEIILGAIKIIVVSYETDAITVSNHGSAPIRNRFKQHDGLLVGCSGRRSSGQQLSLVHRMPYALHMVPGPSGPDRQCVASPCCRSGCTSSNSVAPRPPPPRHERPCYRTPLPQRRVLGYTGRYIGMLGMSRDHTPRAAHDGDLYRFLPGTTSSETAGSDDDSAAKLDMVVIHAVHKLLFRSATSTGNRV